MMNHHKAPIIFYFIYLSIYNITYGRPINEITEPINAPGTEIPSGFIDTSSQNNNELKPSEIQKAVCTVTSGDVRASAEAFTTRELKGVCGSTEMLTAFNDLETRLGKELQELRRLVHDLHQHFITITKNNETQINHTEISEKLMTSSTNSNFTLSPFKFQPIPVDNKLHKIHEISKNLYKTPKFKSLETKAYAMREQEFPKFNNTLITDKDVKVYKFYWKMENFTKYIKSENSTSVESPIFSIKGKSFKIKVYFQHLHRDFLYLQLEDYSSTPQLSLGNSIILDTGGIFKEINSEQLKYKISILNQNKIRSSDLVSQEFDNLDSGFLIPNSALIDSFFIKDDTLLIQISLHI